MVPIRQDPATIRHTGGLHARHRNRFRFCRRSKLFTVCFDGNQVEDEPVIPMIPHSHYDIRAFRDHNTAVPVIHSLIDDSRKFAAFTGLGVDGFRNSDADLCMFRNGAGLSHAPPGGTAQKLLSPCRGTEAQRGHHQGPDHKKGPR